MVLLREALSQSRRPRTWWLRQLFAGAPLGIVVLFWTATLESATTVDASQFGQAGRSLFGIYAATQLFLVTLIAPALVAQGIIEEREDRTLDLLVLSRLSAADVLWGKVGSRLLTLLTLIAAGLPTLSIITSLGGVSPWEVIHVTSVTLLVAVVLGAIGGFTALLTESTAIPVAAALGYGMFVLMAIPTCLVGVNPTRSAMDSAIGLLVWLPWLPVIAQIVYLGAPVLRISTTDDSDEEFGLLSPDIWRLERFKRQVALAWLVTFVAPMLTAVVLGAIDLTLGLRVPAGNWVGYLLTGSWATLALYATTSAYLLAILTATRAAHRRKTARTQARAAKAAVNARSSRVWSNPVLWRAVRRHAPSRLQGGLWAILLTLLVGARGVWGQDFGEDFGSALGVMIWAGTTLVAGLTVVRSSVDERLRRTLPLLLATPLASWRIVLAKAVGPQIRLAAPLLLMFVAFCIDWLSQPGACDHSHFLGPNLGRGMALTHLSGLAWHGSTLLLVALLTTSMALRLRPRSLVWPSALALGMIALVGPLVLNPVAQDLDWPPLHAAVVLWAPYLSSGGLHTGLTCTNGGIPLGMALSTVLQLLASLVVLAMASWAIHRIRWGNMDRANR